MKRFNTFRNRLILWYATSLLTITAFFYIGIHILRLPNGDIVYFLLVFVLALQGLFIIRKLTDGLTYLSSKIQTITSKNLNEKITEINRDDEIGEMAHAFNQLLSRLDEAFRREGQFIGDVAHELKTPLSVQRASLELTLSKDRSKEDYKIAIEEALSDSNRISTTIKNILDLAWSNTEDAQKGATTINISEVVTEVKEVATKLAFDKNLIINGSIDKDVIISGRKDKLFRAFLNIVDNAVKFSPNNASITIDLRTKNNLAVFQVKDNGLGIHKEDLPYVFERFYRGSRTDKIFGSGLGLAIVQAVVKAHQGTIDITSKVGKGTFVAVSLPKINIS